MQLGRVLTDIKLWILLGIVLGLGLGFESPHASTVLIVVMIAQMSVALDGIAFSRRDVKEYGRPVAISVILFFVLSTLVTLATGWFFIDDTALWYGWVVMASCPCAITVVTCTLYVKGNVKLAVLSLTFVYLISIAFAPLLSHSLIGDSVDPLEILKYILLFVLVPFAITIPLRRLHLKPTPKSAFISVTMFLIVFISIGTRRDYILSEPTTIGELAIACIVRICVVCVVFTLLYRKLGCTRDEGLNYAMMSFWKNSGMTISMAMTLFSTVYPEAVLPAVVSTVVETAWFAVMPNVVNRIWPKDGASGASS